MSRQVGWSQSCVSPGWLVPVLCLARLVGPSLVSRQVGWSQSCVSRGWLLGLLLSLVSRHVCWSVSSVVRFAAGGGGGRGAVAVSGGPQKLHRHTHDDRPSLQVDVTVRQLNPAAVHATKAVTELLPHNTCTQCHLRYNRLPLSLFIF